MTQSALILGVDRSDLLKVELDCELPGSVLLSNMADAYDVSLAWLEHGTETKVSRDLMRELKRLPNADARKVLAILVRSPRSK